MALTLFNTLKGEKSEFTPIQDKKAGIYSCGPTVYDYAHIGNMRAYLFMDMLGRVLKFNGYEITQVMNITDVGHLVSDADEGEDKLVKGARKMNKTPWEIAEHFTEAFFRDIRKLNIALPDFTPKATEHIREMIDFVQGLMEKGYAYELRDGIYFDIQKFNGYGKLSRQNLDDLLAGARIGVNPEKRHPSDFALWIKAPKEHIMQWDSPWGMGYPGWHIECSAMSRRYLGDVLDIHTGGVDHIPIHHENEIAQSEALLGKPAVNYWMHCEFMMVNNGKMGKSLGNLYTLDDLQQRGYSPLVFRYFCLNAHYSSKLNFTWEAIKSADISLKRLIEGAAAHKNAPNLPGDKDVENYRKAFIEAVNDDINIPKALGVTWNVVRSPRKSDALYKLLLEMDQVLGLGMEAAVAGLEAPEASEELSPELAELAAQRKTAREQKDWKKSDEIRDKLKEMGYNVIDSKDGMRLEKI